MTFTQPIFLWFALLCAAIMLLAYGLTERSREPTLKTSRPGEAPASGPIALLRWVPRLGWAAAVGFALAALARPQTTETFQRTLPLGQPLILAIDVSESMETRDLAPNRLEAAKTVAQDFLKRLRDERTGLVVFAEGAYAYAPITPDHGFLQQLIATLRPGILPKEGTALGESIGTALARLEAANEEGGAILLFTDGAGNRGGLGPRAAAMLAEQRNVRIYSILLGQDSTANAAPPAGQGSTQKSTDPVTLQAIAESSGGAFFRATDRLALSRILRDIRQREASRSITRTERRTQERYPLLLSLALASAVLALLAGSIGLQLPREV